MGVYGFGRWVSTTGFGRWVARTTCWALGVGRWKPLAMALGGFEGPQEAAARWEPKYRSPPRSRRRQGRPGLERSAGEAPVAWDPEVRSGFVRVSGHCPRQPTPRWGRRRQGGLQGPDRGGGDEAIIPGAQGCRRDGGMGAGATTRWQRGGRRRRRGVRRRQRGSPRVLGWKAVENDQVPAVPTSFVGRVGGGWRTFSVSPYKVGRRLTPISGANRCTRRFGANQFGGYIRRKGKSL